MPPQSRGSQTIPFPPFHHVHSKSTPNLQTLRSQFESTPGVSGHALTETHESRPPPAFGSELVNGFSTHTTHKQSRHLLTDVINDLHPILRDNDGDDDERDDDDEEAWDSDEMKSRDDGESDEQDGDADQQPFLNEPAKLLKRPVYYHASRSFTHLSSTAFAPPFYNRPPNPLPPSPSLTSLLRPTFGSAQNTRPNTPEPSSDEDPASQKLRAGNTSTSLTRSSSANIPSASTIALVENLTRSDPSAPSSSTAAAATNATAVKLIPRASPKVPTYEYYGFTLYLTSSLAFIVYLLWSFLPSPILHQLGFYYYPDRWWALAIPAWTVMFGVYIYVALAAYNTGTLTLPLNGVETLVDEAANVAVVDPDGKIQTVQAPSWSKPSPRTPSARDTIDANELRDDARRKDDTRRARDEMRGEMRSREQSRNHAEREHTRHLWTRDDRPPLSHELDWKTLWNEGTDAVMDVPLGGICQILYGS